MAKISLLNTLLDKKEELRTELGENSQKMAEQGGYGGAARTAPDMGRGIPDPRKKRRLPPSQGPGPNGDLDDSYPEGGLEDEGLPPGPEEEGLPPEEEAGIEPEPEEVPEKEYLGNTQDTHFYIVQGEDVEGEGRDEDLGPASVSSLQIVDQDGEVIFSAEQSDVEFDDTIGFIMAAIQEVDIEVISRDIYDKYFLPELNRDDDEEDMTEPGEEEFEEEGFEEEGFEEEEGFDEEAPPADEMAPPEEEGGVRGPMGPGPRDVPPRRRRKRRRPSPGPGGPGGAPPRGPRPPFESKVELKYKGQAYTIPVVESPEGGCMYRIGTINGMFSRKLMETYNKMELTLSAMLLDAMNCLDERGMSDMFDEDAKPVLEELDKDTGAVVADSGDTSEADYMQYLAELYDDPDYGSLLKKGDPILFEVGMNEWMGQRESSEWRMGEGCTKGKKKEKKFEPAEADKDVQKK